GLPDGGPPQDREAALGRARIVVARVDEIGHAHLAVHFLTARLRLPDLLHAFLAALVVDEQARTGVLREGDDAMDGLALGRGRRGRQVPRRTRPAPLRRAAQLLHDVQALRA